MADTSVPETARIAQRRADLDRHIEALGQWIDRVVDERELAVNALRMLVEQIEQSNAVDDQGPQLRHVQAFALAAAKAVIAQLEGRS